MDVRNCKNCGKLFQYVGKPLCPACNKKLEDKFFEVRDYIYENPTANMSQVSEEMEVPIQQIKKWVREERLAFSKDSGITISCENAENLFLREDFAMNVRKQCKMICQKCMVLKIKFKRVQQRILMEKCVSLKTD